MIAIVDTGGANLASLDNAFQRLNRKSKITGNAAEIRLASHVILPGVGAAGDAMDRIRRQGLVGCLRNLSQPVLGICLGMQILFESSEEGGTECLGILKGVVKRLPNRAGLPVPHMGWNRVRRERPTGLLEGIPDFNHFYFVHSFAAPMGDWVTGSFDYGDDYPAAVQCRNFFGVQFHPERSSTWGSRLLERFLEL